MRIYLGSIAILALLLLVGFHQPVHIPRPLMLSAQDTVLDILTDTLSIDEVSVERRLLSPEQRLEQRQREYRTIYLHGDNKKIIEGFYLFPPVVVLNINKLYNHFSASGKQSRRMQQVLVDDFEKDKIEQIWHPLTRKYARLEGQALEDFRRYYEPDYLWITQAAEWEKLDYLYKKLNHYQDSAHYIREHLRLP